MNCELMLTYDTPAPWQTGSRNLMGPKTLPTIWGTYTTLVTKYQISVINSCWEKCDEKCAYMFNVYKGKLSRQRGSRNLMGPKTLPTIWYTYMMLVTKYQISAINSHWEKCDEKYLGRTDGRTDRGKTVYPHPPSGSRGIKKTHQNWMNERLLVMCPSMPRLLCKFKYWNYSVITSVRSVVKAYHTSHFSLTSYHLETKNFANFL
jgi:hypothetical protein